jgi:hypothetical protein
MHQERCKNHNQSSFSCGLQSHCSFASAAFHCPAMVLNCRLNSSNSSPLLAVPVSLGISMASRAVRFCAMIRLQRSLSHCSFQINHFCTNPAQFSLPESAVPHDLQQQLDFVAPINGILSQVRSAAYSGGSSTIRSRSKVCSNSRSCDIPNA